ncbi:MAG: hypothetical protein AAF658_06810 [Myxococcota bacterium]
MVGHAANFWPPLWEMSLDWFGKFGAKRKRASEKPLESVSLDGADRLDGPLPPFVVELPEELCGDPTAELAYSLTLVNPKFVKRRPAGWRRFWYRGEEQYFDVFIDVDPESMSEVRWFQFTFRGRVVTWDAEKNVVTTGVTNEMAGDQGFSSAKLLARHAQTDGGLVGLVLDVLQHRTDSIPLVAARRKLRRAAENQGLCRRPTLH